MLLNSMKSRLMLVTMAAMSVAGCQSSGDARQASSEPAPGETPAGHRALCEEKGMNPADVQRVFNGNWADGKLTHTLFLEEPGANGKVRAWYAHGEQRSWDIDWPACWVMRGEQDADGNLSFQNPSGTSVSYEVGERSVSGIYVGRNGRPTKGEFVPLQPGERARLLGN